MESDGRFISLVVLFVGGENIALVVYDKKKGVGCSLEFVGWNLC